MTAGSQSADDGGGDWGGRLTEAFGQSVSFSTLEMKPLDENS